jgi:hypothetical protein
MFYVSGCPKEKERAKLGHRCKFSIKLTMLSEEIGVWLVELEGSHVPPTAIWEPAEINPLHSSNVSLCPFMHSNTLLGLISCVPDHGWSGLFLID